MLKCNFRIAAQAWYRLRPASLSFQVQECWCKIGNQKPHVGSLISQLSGRPSDFEMPPKMAISTDQDPKNLRELLISTPNRKPKI